MVPDSRETLRASRHCVRRKRFVDWRSAAPWLRTSRLPLWLVLLLLPMPVSAESVPPFTTVKSFFSGLSAREADSIRPHITNDFQLLEHGEVWDTDRLISAVAGDYLRRNYFHLLREEVDNDMAWVSYWNRATITAEGALREHFWLESAVLVRERDAWRIRMLHSTRVDSDAIPAGLDLKEHIDD